jgi:hypothetical protein
MVIEIAALARSTFLRLPRDIRRSVSRRAQEIAEGKIQGAIDHGGGVFSFKASGDIVVYVSVQAGVRVRIEHIIGR